MNESKTTMDTGVGAKKSNREGFAKPWDFVLALLAGSIGLGNVWRFPYLCFKNGGGAFLIPYLFFVTAIGMPMVMLETSLGQRVRRGIMQSWAITPILKGVALAQIVMVMHCNICYAVIMAWAFKYLAVSFVSPLPWSTCHNPWNSAGCLTATLRKEIGDIKVMHGKSGENLSTVMSSGSLAPITTNSSANNLSNSSAVSSSATEYWFQGVLGVTSSLNESGNFRTDLVICFIAVWVLTYFATFKGIQWTSKIVYVTATVPFVLIIVILIRGVTLEGAASGLRYYLIPDISKIIIPEVWTAAGTQVMYSFSIGFGVLTTLGSYNSYHHDFWRDACVFSFCNAMTSFVSGFAVFSSLGHMAHYQNTTVEEVASSGPGLVFIAYPQALSLLPLPQLWSVVFFLMLILIAFDSMFIAQEALVAFLFDNVAALRRRKLLCHALICAVLFAAGLPMVKEGGIFVFEMYNNYGTTGWCLFLMAACECVAIAWLYGFDSYWDEITDMIGPRLGRMWLLVTWKFLCPIICVVMAVYFVTAHKPLTYLKYVYPPWAQAIAHLMSFSSVVMIPGYAIYIAFKTWRNGGNLKRLVRQEAPKMRLEETLHRLTSQP